MPTYSINVGTLTESAKLDNVISALNQLQDNTSKLISPKDARDAIFTTWESIIFKPTQITGSTISYIGVDQNYLKSKVFFGKKQISGSDVMNNLLLSDQFTDFYFYNNKTDSSLSNQNTRLSFLSGTNSSIWIKGSSVSVPYIQSSVVTSIGGSYLDLDIRNQSYYIPGGTPSGGNISISSDYGKVVINGLAFPSFVETAASASDGKVLKYYSGNLKWEDPILNSVTSIISGSTVSITGSPVIINGYDVSFSDSTPTPDTLGGILEGSTFSNIPVTEMLRRILYPYLTPLPSISIPNSVVEIRPNTPINPITINYSIDKRSPTASISYNINDTPVSIIGSTNSVSSSTSGTDSNQSSETPKIFTLFVTDSAGSGLSQSASVSKTYPFYYGTNTSATSSTSFINSILGTSSVFVTNKLTKIVELKSDKTFALVGNNVGIYIAHPASWGTASSILDQNLFDVFSSFTVYNMNLNSSQSYWTSTPYKVYIYNGGTGNPQLTTIDSSPLYTGTYKINF